MAYRAKIKQAIAALKPNSRWVSVWNRVADSLGTLARGSKPHEGDPAVIDQLAKVGEFSANRRLTIHAANWKDPTTNIAR